MNIGGRQSKPINHECTHGHYNSKLNGDIDHVAAKCISRTSRIFIYQLSSPPASNTLVWGKCLTVACSNSRSRVSCSLIKLINNYNYNVEHVKVWQADNNRHSTTLMTSGTSTMSPDSTPRYWSLPMHYIHIDGRQSTSLNAWTRCGSNCSYSD